MTTISALKNLGVKWIGLLALAVPLAGIAQGVVHTIAKQPVSANANVGDTVMFEMTAIVDPFDDASVYNVSVLHDGGEVATTAGSGGRNTADIDATVSAEGMLLIRYTLRNVTAGSAGAYTFKITDRNGRIFVIDGGADVLRIISQSGTAGTRNFTPAEPIRAAAVGGIHAAAGSVFNDPRGLAVDSKGNIFVADRLNHAIRKINPDGTIVTFAGNVGTLGSADGTGTAARFTSPYSLALDSSDTLYVSDSGNSLIRKITPAGVVTTISGRAGAGSVDGPVSTAKFFSPFGLVVDSAGTIFVADALNNSVRKITTAGVVSTLAGVGGKAGSADGTGGAALFSYPCGLALDATGNLYVSDGLNNTIRKITPAGVVTTIAGSPGNSGSADGTGSAARFYYPWGLAVDPETGKIFIADSGNGTIRTMTPAGVVTTLAGSAGNAGSSDGTGSAARFTYPYEIRLAPYTFASNSATLSIAVPTSAPAISAPPANQTGATGGSVTFTVTATGGASYQWQKNGVNIAGANSPTLTLPSLSANDAGTYRVVVINALGSVTSAGATLIVAPAVATRISNLSIRSTAGTGANTLIVGFVVGGAGSKQVLVRGIGPALTQFGVGGALADPQLALHTTVNNQDTTLASNSIWGGTSTLSTAFSQVGAFPLTATSKDAALLSTLATGAYTAQVVSASGGSGVTLLEVYDSDVGIPPARFINLSARTQAGTGSQTLIAGFVVSGTGTKTVVVRGIGPTLSSFGVGGVLSNPQLSLHTTVNGQDTVVASNAGWGGTATLTTAFTQVGAFPLPATSADAAMLVTLAPGSYTAQITGVNNTSGVALIEVYEMP